MTNRIKGEVPLKLRDGRELIVVLDHEALIEAEAAYGKSLQALIADAAAGFMGASRALLYGALHSHHPDLSLKDAAKILFENAETAGAALSQAYEASMPDPSKASAEGNGEAKRPAGKTSGANGAKPA